MKEVSSSRLRSKFERSNSEVFVSLVDYRNKYFPSDDPHRIIEYCGSGSYSVARSNENKEYNLLQLEVGKAGIFLGSNSRITFEKAYRTTAEWYKTYYYNRDNLIGSTQYKVNTFQNSELK
ncbi:MAG: hypothetical protein QXU18_03390 [Thermoplasmatales archaeon]